MHFTTNMSDFEFIFLMYPVLQCLTLEEKTQISGMSFGLFNSMEFTPEELKTVAKKKAFYAIRTNQFEMFSGALPGMSQEKQDVWELLEMTCKYGRSKMLGKAIDFFPIRKLEEYKGEMYRMVNNWIFKYCIGAQNKCIDHDGYDCRVKMYEMTDVISDFYVETDDDDDYEYVNDELSEVW